MKTAAQIGGIREAARVDKRFAVDTTFVLFFLAVEFGLNLRAGFFENIFLGITLAAVAVLPYLTFSGEKPAFGNWLLGRFLIFGFAFLLGIAFRQVLGVLVPAEFAFLPMTLLLVAACLSCYIQYYNFFKLRRTNI